MTLDDADGAGTAVERKPVTVLFCDLVGSTALSERLDAETMRTVQAAYFDRVRSVVEGFEGTVEKFIGDAVVAVFGVPQVHEDDAERAVRCALRIREGIEGLNDTLRARFGVELSVRIGIESGEAVISAAAAAGETSGGAIATGDVMNTAARLQQAAEPGEILVGREAMHLTRGAVDYGGRRAMEARGKAELVEAWSPHSVSPAVRRFRSPLVGRMGELEAMAASLEAAIKSGRPRTLIVVGEPGIGKTRLSVEFEARATGRARFLRGTCLPYGEGTTWSPLVEMLRQEDDQAATAPDAELLASLERAVAGRHPPDEAGIILAQLGALVGGAGGSRSSGPELLWALRRYVEGLARTSPVVLAVDDLHLAEETLMETVLELAATLEPVPAVLLCLGRPELLERMADAVGVEGTTVVRVEPLRPEEAERLISNLSASVGEDRLRAEEVAGRATGNPLFIEEIVAMASEETRGTERVPGSLRALIAARLDLLPPGAKRVAQAAAVVGDVFWDGAVSALLSEDWEEAGAASAFRTLRSRGLIEEERGSGFLGQRQFRFHHALVREVAYASLPKRDRSRMHLVAARWLEPRAAERPSLLAGVAGHFDQALRLAEEVAPLEPLDPRLSESAGEALLQAGLWTASNAALPEAVKLLRRAGDASKQAPAVRIRALAALASVLAWAGEADEAIRVAQQVLATERRGEAAALGSLALAEVGKSRGLPEEMRPNAERAVELSGGAFPAIDARALDVLAWVAFWGGDSPDAEERWRQASERAMQAGDVALAARATGYRSLSATLRLDVRMGEELAELAMDMANRSGTLVALVAAHTALARLREFQDRLDEAVDSGREWVRLAIDAGDRVDAIAGYVFGVATPLRLQGRLEEALAALEKGLEMSMQLGGSAYADNLRLDGARILAKLGRIDEARRELEALRVLPQLDPKTSRVLPAWATATVEAAAGEFERAERAWLEGLEGIRLWSEEISTACDYHFDFATFLLDRGRRLEATEVLEELAARIEGMDCPLYRRLLVGLQARAAGGTAR